MKKKEYLQPLTEIVDVAISNALLSSSSLKVKVELDDVNDEVPESRRHYNVWEDEESDDED